MWCGSREGSYGSHAWELHIRCEATFLLVPKREKQCVYSSRSPASRDVIDLFSIRLDVRRHLLSTFLLGPVQLQRRRTGRHFLGFVRLPSYPRREPDASTYSYRSPGPDGHFQEFCRNNGRNTEDIGHLGHRILLGYGFVRRRCILIFSCSLQLSLSYSILFDVCALIHSYCCMYCSYISLLCLIRLVALCRIKFCSFFSHAFLRQHSRYRFRSSLRACQVLK